LDPIGISLITAFAQARGRLRLSLSAIDHIADSRIAE
jgi:hypothetical protein